MSIISALMEYVYMIHAHKLQWGFFSQIMDKKKSLCVVGFIFLSQSFVVAVVAFIQFQQHFYGTTKNRDRGRVHHHHHLLAVALDHIYVCVCCQVQTVMLFNYSNVRLCNL